MQLALAGCAGVRPNPRYRSDEPPDPPPRHESPRNNDQPRGNLTTIERKLTQRIEAYLGVPYRWGGTTSRGMDCSGFVSVVFHEALNVPLPHRAKLIYKEGRKVPKDALVFGDLVFFRNIEERGVSHVGIYVGNGKFAHASTTRGVVISRLSEKYYRQRYIGAKRILRN